MPEPTQPLRRIPAGVWALGFVSLLMDVSSELIHSLLPVFMLTTLGVSVFAIGLIEGAAEATALIVKVFSGVLSDYWGKRKPLAILGYGLGALSKPLFALAGSAGLVLSARLLDRVGKGIRGAPRDALVADITPPELRGAAFGLRQSLDTVGAFLGPLLAMGLMLLWANDFRAVFWVAVIPAFLAVALLLFGVREPASPLPTRRVNPIRRESLQQVAADLDVGLPDQAQQPDERHSRDPGGNRPARRPAGTGDHGRGVDGKCACQPGAAAAVPGRRHLPVD